MDVFALFWPALRSVIRQAWPEIQGDTHPIYRATQSMRRPWRQLLEDGQMSSPWVIVSVSNPPAIQGYGSINVVYNPTVTVAYCTDSLGATDVADIGASIDAKIAELQDVLTAHAFTGFQCQMDFRPDTSENNPVNLVFADQNVPFFGGCLSFSVLIGYSV